jgi:RNA polymerase sigma-70 factor (ECF subfamily)
MATYSSAPLTSLILLSRLRSPLTREEAWRQFLRRYQPLLDSWCRHHGLGREDCEDIVQEVLLRVARAIPDYRYRPGSRFRGWLATIVRNTLTDRWRKIASSPQTLDGGDLHVYECLEQAAAPESLESLSTTWYERLQEDLRRAEEVVRRVRARVQEHTWQSFWLTVYEELPAAKAADQLGIPVASVYVAKKRVADLVRKVVKELEAEAVQI